MTGRGESQVSQPVRIALLGCGGVGSEVYRLLGQQAADLAARIGAPLEVAGVAVRRPGRARLPCMRSGPSRTSTGSAATSASMAG